MSPSSAAMPACRRLRKEHPDSASLAADPMEMFLAIDVGNTQTVLGVYGGTTLQHHWRLQTVSGRTADEYGVLVCNLLAGSSNPEIGGVAVSCVVPPMSHTVEVMCRKYLGVVPLFVGPGVRTGM